MRFSRTAESSLDRGGSVAVDAWRFAWSSRPALDEATRLLFGVDWTRHDLELTGARWLPDRLQTLAVPVGIAHRWDERWRLLINAQPRWAAAGSGLSSAGFNVPLLALASFNASPKLTWNFGLRYSADSDLKLLPLAGVVWRFAPRWEAALTFPESAVSYRATTRLTGRVIASVHGGDYWTREDPRAAADRSAVSLADTWLEYRAIRMGLAADFALGKTATLRADAGWVVDQRFDYFARGLKLDGGAPAYFALSMVGHF